MDRETASKMVESAGKTSLADAGQVARTLIGSRFSAEVGGVFLGGGPLDAFLYSHVAPFQHPQAINQYYIKMLNFSMEIGAVVWAHSRDKSLLTVVETNEQAEKEIAAVMALILPNWPITGDLGRAIEIGCAQARFAYNAKKYFIEV